MVMRHEVLKERDECHRIIKEMRGQPTQSDEATVSTSVGEVIVSITQEGEQEHTRLMPVPAPRPAPPPPPPRERCEDKPRRKRRRGHRSKEDDDC